MQFVDIDKNGNNVYVGDFISFTWWQYMGSEVETHVQGRIVNYHKHLCFKYKRNNKFSIRRLSALDFDPGMDWEKTNDTSYKNNI